ncbi:MAG: hydroxypyruvate reductase [Acidobacteria bacterium]|nr:MAG: hydroxypyruvate reductase [Acidobacteriota bacterium]
MFNTAHDMRALARQIFLSALAETSVEKSFEKHVEVSRRLLRVGEDLHDLNSFSRVFVVAMGKAAYPMAQALKRQLGMMAGGIVVAPPAPSAETQPMLEGFRHFAGGHPLPNAESVRAASAILGSLGSLAGPTLVIYLISGGASSMVEKPLDDEITLDDLIATYRALVNCGAPIVEINAIRKHLSAVKGGRMALAANSGAGVENVQQVSILVSDVPESALDALASGPTMPDSTTSAECYEIAQKHGLLDAFPISVRDLFAKKLLEETPKYEDGVSHNSRWWPILSNAVLQKAAATQAALAGFAVEIDNTCDDWEYGRAAGYLLERLRKLRRGAARVCLISGGEVTVRVPPDTAGVGGRNQQFALDCACKIAGENVTVLSAGSDGIDGISPAAGAVVDGTTLSRANSQGLSADAALAGFNAYPFFEALGDALITGPTGNNVRDLRILMGY